MRVWLAILVLGVVVTAGLSIHLVERAAPAPKPAPEGAPEESGGGDATLLGPGAPTLPDPAGLGAPSTPVAGAANATGTAAPPSTSPPDADAPAAGDAASDAPVADAPPPPAPEAPAPDAGDDAPAADDAPPAPPTPPPAPPAPWTRTWTHRYTDAARVVTVEVEPDHPRLELDVVFTRDSSLPLVLGSGEVSLAAPGRPAAVATCNTPAVPDALQRCLRTVNLPAGGTWELRFVGSGEILATVTLRAT